MGKVLRTTQRLFTEGTGIEKTYEREELRERVRKFQQSCRGLPLPDRELALMKLIEKISKGEEDLEFLQAIIKSGGWLLELEGCYKRARWLKTILRRQ